MCRSFSRKRLLNHLFENWEKNRDNNAVKKKKKKFLAQVPRGICREFGAFFKICAWISLASPQGRGFVGDRFFMESS